MASTYSQILIATDEIAARINTNRRRVTQAQTLVNAAVIDLGGMASLYGPVVSDVDALAIAEPANAAAIAAKASMDKLVAEFIAFQATVSALQSAMA